ncbi:Tubulin/FtsZ family, GTPase domain-containing protein [Blastocladiella britannica]|nr:Tubulin/FtsZ family, GTPase domain-containing protein [Blastocladiella britannica]
MLLPILVGQAAIQSLEALRTESEHLLPALKVDAEHKTRPDVVLSSVGCGNNWSTGYFALDPEPALNAARRRIEAVDSFSGFLISYATAGGTGSGLGSRLTAELRDAIGEPKACMHALPVVPFSSGDTAVQSYNSVLALATAIEHADMVVPIVNDRLLRMACPVGAAAKRRGPNHDSGKDAPVDHLLGMNRTASSMVVHGYLASSPTGNYSVWDPVTATVPLPTCPIVSCTWSGAIRGMPTTPPDALSALDALLVTVPALTQDAPFITSCIGAQLHVSRPLIASPPWKWSTVQSRLRTRLKFAQHLYDPLDPILQWRSVLPQAAPGRMGHSQATLSNMTLLYNSASSATSLLVPPLIQATKRFSVGSFLHHYTNAVGTEWIPLAIEQLWGTVDAYRWAVSPE